MTCSTCTTDAGINYMWLKQERLCVKILMGCAEDAKSDLKLHAFTETDPTGSAPASDNIVHYCKDADEQSQVQATRAAETRLDTRRDYYVALPMLLPAGCTAAGSEKEGWHLLNNIGSATQ